jgi:hypothetical protein
MKIFTAEVSHPSAATIQGVNAEFLVQTRELVGDPTKAPALHELLRTEAARVIERMRDDTFSPGTAYSVDELVRRLAAYEALAENLARAAVLVAYWARTTDDRLVPGLVATLANAVERSTGQAPYLDLVRYPALLVLYGGGLGAVIGGREEQLVGLLAPRTLRERQEWTATAVALSGPAVIEHRIAGTLPGLERHHTPVSDHLVEVFRPWFTDLESDQESFERAFDRWEYLDGLVAYDLSSRGGRGGWGPVGRFSWRGEYRTSRIDVEIAEEIAAAGASWPLLRAGLFAGDPTRLKESLEGWHQHIAAIRRQF